MNGIGVRQLAHVCILARDLAATRRFYAEVLGMPVVFEFLREGEAFGFYLDAGGRSNVEVFHASAADFGEHARIDHLCLEVESIDRAIEHLRARGIEVGDKRLGCDETWQAWLRDPDGTRIELFEYTAGSAQFSGGDRIADW